MTGEHLTPTLPDAPTDSPLAGALAILAAYGDTPPSERFGLDEPSREQHEDAATTALMDLYRRTGDAAVFEALVAIGSSPLLRRVRARTRFLGHQVDPQEVLQDTFINVYRYPDKFDGSRPGAFRAWASTIVDNTIRRHLRRSTTGPDVQLRPVELLSRERDTHAREPGTHVMQTEDCRRALQALRLFLCCYLDAYHALSERERFVLQMVEVRSMRYAELAKILEIRPEALKMVVFRARRRIFDRISRMFGDAVRTAA